MRLQVTVASICPQPGLSKLQTCIVHYVVVLFQKLFELIPTGILHNNIQKTDFVWSHHVDKSYTVYLHPSFTSQDYLS
jgi:hypothetical protein